jgi:hypothetical protein
MSLRWLTLICLAFCALSPRQALAASDGAPTAVLGLEAIDVPTSLVDQVSNEMRQRVSASTDMRLVSGKDLVELKLVFACADEGHACMAQAGKSLDAEKLIYGSVKKTGSDFAVWLKLFDVRKEKLESWLTETLPAGQADATGVQAAAGRWFSKLTGHPLNAGTLLITANPAGATITLDGIPVGVSTAQPLTLSEVKPGKHEVVATKAGLAGARQQFMVAVGQTVSVNLNLRGEGTTEVAGAGAASSGDGNATLRRRAEPSSSDRDAEGRSGYRTGFWVTMGAGLLSAGAAVKFGLDVLKINKDLDQYRRYPCAQNPLESCDIMKNVAPLSDQERSARDGKISEGERDRNLQWVFIGVGSALGITSAYLFYKGYLDSEDGAPSHREAKSGLRIFPTAGVTSGGILAEFDF